MGSPTDQGPFREALGDDDRYELSKGRAVYCKPGGGRHGGRQFIGTLAVGADPKARGTSGTDVGFQTEATTLRAPDLGVGGVDPDRPGWVAGAPALAIEYADVGTDEADLATKIQELFAGGTAAVWVVRLVGPRRVEVHTADGATTLHRSGEQLPPGDALERAVPVDALFDRDAAEAAAFGHILRRYGYESLTAVRDEAQRALLASARGVLARAGHTEDEVAALLAAITAETQNDR